MLYQVLANLYFIDNDEAEDFYHDCDLAYAKAHDINPNEDNFEGSVIQLIENHHDEDPLVPCVLLREKRTQPQ